MGQQEFPKWYKKDVNFACKCFKKSQKLQKLRQFKLELCNVQVQKALQITR